MRYIKDINAIEAQIAVLEELTDSRAYLINQRILLLKKELVEYRSAWGKYCDLKIELRRVAEIDRPREGDMCEPILQELKELATKYNF